MRHPILVAGLAGMRRNLLPGLALWAFALALVLLYALAPAARPAFERIAGWKRAGGYAFSAAASAVAGGVVPFVALLLLGRLPRQRLAVAAFLICFWAYRGMEVDAFYRFQAWLFGPGTDPATVAKKVVVDQFVYSAFWTGPCGMLAMRWKDCGFDWRRLRASLDRRTWTVQLPSVLLSLWAVWIPTVCIVYALPPSLQVPLFAVVLCFWVLLIEALAAKPAAAATTPVAA